MIITYIPADVRQLDSLRGAGPQILHGAVHVDQLDRLPALLDGDRHLEYDR